MTNPICTAMGWTAPPTKQILHISMRGKLVAILVAADPQKQTFEGVYLSNPDGICYGSCFSATKGVDPRIGLARKLKIRMETLELLSAHTCPKV